MNNPINLKYTASHEWVEFLEGGRVRVGLTDHAQDALGDLVFVNLPSVGDDVVAGSAMGDVESVKAVSDINAPVTGVICAVNDDVAEDPAKVNSDPYGAWFVEVENVTDQEDLMDSAVYERFCEEGA